MPLADDWPSNIACKVLKRFDRAKVRVFQLDLRGFDPAQIEQIVNELQQQIGIGVKRLHHLAFLEGLHFIHQQPRETDHGVHRRTDFMAHGGEKIALGLIGGLGFFLGFGQFLALAFVFGDEEAQFFLALFFARRCQCCVPTSL